MKIRRLYSWPGPFSLYFQISFTCVRLTTTALWLIHRSLLSLQLLQSGCAGVSCFSLSVPPEKVKTRLTPRLCWGDGRPGFGRPPSRPRAETHSGEFCCGFRITGITHSFCTSRPWLEMSCSYLRGQEEVVVGGEKTEEHLQRSAGRPEVEKKQAVKTFLLNDAGQTFRNLSAPLWKWDRQQYQYFKN